ncbi:MAG TPA: regulatory iron-sulfur-containing complex subunit RicT [Bacteroidia bacterium]|nr:regulatory iron-sulfur-containing complex subunit RicT [Bacteroidia bacterium]
MNVFDWLANMELPSGQGTFDCVEIRFKNSRKEFFRNVNNLQLNVGDVVAVEASPGHDMGVVSISGELVRLQMKKRNVNPSSEEIKKIYRKAKPMDIEKWQEAQGLEQATMYRARTIAVKLNLQMKISDVEYQGDRTKAIFYYTADDRVDFRELIKVLAEEFKVRIEMRQIGARQEASRLGAIGSCGRELCCSTWLTDFRSVATSAARYQQLSLNPLKLAGQCGKLKCCLNYELDSYMDALKDFPEVNNVKLETNRGRAFHQKTDIFRRTMFFSYTDEPDNFIPLTVDRVKEVMEMNKNGVKPEDLSIKIAAPKIIEKKPDYENVVGQDSLTRFDQKKKPKFKNKKKGGDSKNAGGNAGKQQPQQKQNAQGNKPNNPGGKPNNPGNKPNQPPNKPSAPANRPNPNQQEGRPQPQQQKQQGHQQRNRPKPNNRPRPSNNNNTNKPVQ